MSPVAALPDLARLSDGEKDALIRRLWSIAAAADGGPERLEALAGSSGAATSGAGDGSLLAELRRAASMGRARAPADVRFRLGRGLGLWRSKAVLAVVGLAAAAFAADFGIGWYQARAIEAERVARLELENAAFNQLYVELLRASREPDGTSYRAAVDMQRIGAEAPLYVMLAPVRVFVQSGLVWQEVPAQAAEEGAWGVRALTGGEEYEVVFQADVADWAELIPGYMHVRIDSDMLVSRTSEPSADEIIARDNRFYIYLKPHGADDEDIRRRSNLAGEPPVFMPMPPH